MVSAIYDQTDRQTHILIALLCAPHQCFKFRWFARSIYIANIADL